MFDVGAVHLATTQHTTQMEYGVQTCVGNVISSFSRNASVEPFSSTPSINQSIPSDIRWFCRRQMCKSRFVSKPKKKKRYYKWTKIELTKTNR